MSQVALFEQLVKKNKEYIDKVNSIFKMNLPYPTIRCDITGRNGGTANSGRWEVNYNKHFLSNHTEHFLKQTVGHEVAHLVASRLGGRHHDNIWKSVMRRLGLTPDRCHSYDITALPGYKDNKITMVCDCQEHHVSSILRNKILNGSGHRCQHCKSPLRAKGAPKPLAIPMTTPTGGMVFATLSNPIITPKYDGVDAKKVLLKSTKKPNKIVVANLVNTHPNCSNETLYSLIKQECGVSDNTAKQYLYKHRNNKW